MKTSYGLLLLLSALLLFNPRHIEAESDVEEMTGGMTDYFRLVAKGINQLVSPSTTLNGLKPAEKQELISETQEEPGVDPQFAKHTLLQMHISEDTLRALDLQSKYMDADLGEKNLMWSLRGSQSEQILEKKMDSSGSDEEVTVVRRSRKLIEDSNSWISSLLRNAYPIYSARSDSMFEVQLKNILNTTICASCLASFSLSTPHT